MKGEAGRVTMSLRHVLRTILVGLAVLLVAGGVVLAVLVHDAVSEPPAQSQHEVDAAPVPAGAVRTAHGLFTDESGTEARDQYRLAPGAMVGPACTALVGSLRSAGWNLEDDGPAGPCVVDGDGVASFEASPPRSLDLVGITLQATGGTVLLTYEQGL